MVLWLLLLLNYLLKLMVLTYLSISVEELLIHWTSWNLPAEVEKQSLLLLSLLFVVAIVALFTIDCPCHLEQVEARRLLLLRLDVVKEKACQGAGCLSLHCLGSCLWLQ